MSTGNTTGKEEAKISVFDHGLLYGDGVFEGIRFYHGRVFRLSEHIDRLYDSAKAICLKIPLEKAGLIEAVLETIRKNELHDGYVRLVVTRGSGDLGLESGVMPARDGLHNRFEDYPLSRGDVSQRTKRCDLLNAEDSAWRA